MRCGIRCLVREACSLDWPGPVGLDYAGQAPAGLDKSYQACGIRLDSGLGLADARLEWEKKMPHPMATKARTSSVKMNARGSPRASARWSPT